MLSCNCILLGILATILQSHFDWSYEVLHITVDWRTLAHLQKLAYQTERSLWGKRKRFNGYGCWMLSWVSLEESLRLHLITFHLLSSRNNINIPKWLRVRIRSWCSFSQVKDGIQAHKQLLKLVAIKFLHFGLNLTCLVLLHLLIWKWKKSNTCTRSIPHFFCL